ncbi:cytochrome c biogenesis protein [Winogradskyella aurantiaca]|uniref:cytochrome c biogenesis protein n=1 Tax=Winogradskyella aurantiaca TaxID=2219558 RepID=UPI001E5724E0|nr:cytochrome c biogenesis protein CcsA [Winogradskyella aurantiaca]
MKNILRWLSSPSLALILLLLFGISMAAATFVENDFGTSVAWQLIYDSLWFEMLMLGLGICFVLNIKKYQLLQRRKWAILLFHIAFIVILIGAAVTRYYSTGGVMRIREGESSNIIITNENYLKAKFSKNGEIVTIRESADFNAISQNNFEESVTVDGIPVTLSYNQFVPDAIPQVIEDPANGSDILEMVLSNGNGRENIFLKKGSVEELPDVRPSLVFDSDIKGDINIWETDEGLKLVSTVPLSTFEMATEVAGIIPADTVSILKYRTLYRAGDMSFVPLAFHKQSRVAMVSGSERPKNNDETKKDILKLDLTIGDAKKNLSVPFNVGLIPTVLTDSLNGLSFEISYGAELKTMPFAIKLYDFQLERYPGSTSPSSYASEVEVIDDEDPYTYRIYMNNVLDHKGYRFFQASYDTDEKGTVLAVNHDALGTYITYLGYFLMMLGMFFTLFGKASRFRLVNKRLKNLKTKALFILILLTISNSFAQETDDKRNVWDLAIAEMDEANTAVFSRLLVQDLDGRIKPVHTLASELLRKVSRKPYLKFKNTNNQEQRLAATKVFLGMMASPQVWESVPIIKIDSDKIGDEIDKKLVTDEGFIAFNQLIAFNGQYKLAKAAEIANKKVPSERNEQDKEIIKVDERFNILYNVFVGNYLAVFPNKNDANNKWHSYNHHFEDFPIEDATFAQEIIPEYFRDINTKNWEAAFTKLDYIKTYQEVLGVSIIPSKKKIESEILYNELNLNFWLFQILFTLGGVLLVFSLIKVFVEGKTIELLWNAFILLSLLSFVVFTFNLILRWYIAGHAPWSNGYEMLVFVAWVLLLCGLLTFRQSDFALPLATLFSGALLFVSYLDWLSPEITNLMPVLKSFWLKVHVATIVSSYAPLALSAVLGFMALVLMIIKNTNNQKVIEIKIQELSYINEISMTIGLFVLSVGTFLGGIWANESWGRYWAWDPKETWALISIIVYAIVLHLRFVPRLNNQFVLNSASVFAFASIIMTSFGVNYYLSGLHSYAAGDPVPIPTFVYYVVVIVIVTMVWAFTRNQKYNGLTQL